MRGPDECFVCWKIEETKLLTDEEKRKISIVVQNNGDIIIMYKCKRGGIIFHDKWGMVKSYHNKKDHEVMARLDEALFGKLKPLSDEILSELAEI